MIGNLRIVFVLIFDWMEAHPRLARPIEDHEKKTNADDLFMHRIMRSHNSCDNCVNEQATQRTNANSQTPRISSHNYVSKGVLVVG